MNHCIRNLPPMMVGSPPIESLGMLFKVPGMPRPVEPYGLPLVALCPGARDWRRGRGTRAGAMSKVLVYCLKSLNFKNA